MKKQISEEQISRLQTNPVASQSIELVCMLDDLPTCHCQKYRTTLRDIKDNPKLGIEDIRSLVRQAFKGEK